MRSSEDVSTDLGIRVYHRGEAAQRLGRSLRQVERWIADGTLGHIRYHGRVYVSEEQLRMYETRAIRRVDATYTQPPLPGLGPDEVFTPEQGAAVARVIDTNRARRARVRAKGGAA